MTLSIIAAMGSNRVIGDHNTLPWHLPADFQHFKKLTMGHSVIMGRKTYESIGKPLPKRRNIVITRQAGLEIRGCKVVGSLEDAIQLARNEAEVFVIGGAQIFEQALPFANRMHLTFIDNEFSGDTYFPEYKIGEWRETKRKKISADAENPFNYSFVTLERIIS